MSPLKPPPDFRLLPWRQNRIFDLKSDDGFPVGRYVEYINEKTGKFGVRLEVVGARDPILAWEEGVALGQTERICRYMAYWQYDAWQKIRVGNHYPDRVIREISGSLMKLTLHFGLAIKGEVTVSISIKL